jgi:arginine deiminase
MPTLALERESTVETLPLKERIRRRAYELYTERDSQSGSELDDWLQAEQEILLAEMSARVDEASEESFPSSDAPAY